jgi:hypothetical protein
MHMWVRIFIHMVATYTSMRNTRYWIFVCFSTRELFNAARVHEWYERKSMYTAHTHDAPNCRLAEVDFIQFVLNLSLLCCRSNRHAEWNSSVLPGSSDTPAATGERLSSAQTVADLMHRTDRQVSRS